jgi:hypothetical protein
MIYSSNLNKEEVVKKLNPKNTFATSQSLVKPELLELAKWIIWAIPKLKVIKEL